MNFFRGLSFACYLMCGVDVAVGVLGSGSLLRGFTHLVHVIAYGYFGYLAHVRAVEKEQA